MISEIDEIRLESVKDRRFLGNLKRRRECEIKTKTVKGDFGEEEEETIQEQSEKWEVETWRRFL